MDTTAPTRDTTSIPNQIHPNALWRHLRSIDFALLDTIAFLSRQTARHSPKQAHYCTPGRSWLARKIGVSIGTISRHTTRLKALGMLNKLQRRPVDGKWQTNLYALRGRATWLVARSMQALHRPPNRVPSNAHIAPFKRGPDRIAEARTSLRSIIRTLEARLRGG